MAQSRDELGAGSASGAVANGHSPALEGCVSGVGLPWRKALESHLGDPAWSIFDAAGDRVAVGFTSEDAEIAVRAVNGAPELIAALQICIARDPSLKANVMVCTALAKAGV